MVVIKVQFSPITIPGLQYMIVKGFIPHFAGKEVKEKSKKG